MKTQTLAIMSISCLSLPAISLADTLEDHLNKVNVYQNDNSSLSFSGRLHADAVSINADEGEYDDTDWRRFRFGGKGEVNGFSYKLEADFNLNDGGKYKQLTDANISWQTEDGTNIKLLKQSAGFTLDGATSSNKLKTLERSNVANNLWFTKEYFTGVKLSGDVTEHISYQAGLYSSDGDPEFGIDAGIFALGSLMYSSTNDTYWDSAKFRVDYVSNEKHEEANTRDFKQVLSVSGQFKKNNWGVDAELAGGKGYFDQSDIWGFSTMPFYDVNEAIQLVTRYTYMKSQEDNGLRLNRYESKAVDGRGDQYHELYAGVNYFVHNHKLKFQLGAYYTDMADAANDGGAFNGLTFSVGMRAYW